MGVNFGPLCICELKFDQLYISAESGSRIQIIQKECMGKTYLFCLDSYKRGFKSTTWQLFLALCEVNIGTINEQNWLQDSGLDRQLE